MSAELWRFPAEWEPQTATLLSWPCQKTDWNGPRLDAVQQEFLALIQAILPHQTVVLLTRPDNPPTAGLLPEHSSLRRVEIPYNDTWCRDYGPICLVDSGERLALDFTFNGWGGKYNASLDNQVNQELARGHLFEHFKFRQHLFELEGGAIDTDGRGSVLVNWHCIRKRYPKLSQGALEQQLLKLLQVQRVLGIDVAPLPGDDTDGHIDTIARFVNDETIVFQQGEPEWTTQLREQLEGIRNHLGKPYQLIALPAVSGHHYGEERQVLPTSYANFLFVNNALLVPQYGDAADHRVLEILKPLAGDRQVIGLSAREIVLGNGSLHCCAMNLPAALN